MTARRLEPTQASTLRLSAELHEAAKAIAVARGGSLRQLVEDALRAYVEDALVTDPPLRAAVETLRRAWRVREARALTGQP